MVKRLLVAVVLASCGSGSGGNDAGTDAAADATLDGMSGDTSMDTLNGDVTQDVESQDVDVTDSAFGDSGIGTPCDPNDNQCLTGLLCCPKPTLMLDGGVSYECELAVGDAGTCPMFP